MLKRRVKPSTSTSKPTKPAKPSSLTTAKTDAQRAAHWRRIDALLLRSTRENTRMTRRKRHATSPSVRLTPKEQELKRQIEREVNTPERDDDMRRGKFAALDDLHAVVTTLKRLRGAPAGDSRRWEVLVGLLPLAHLVWDVMMMPEASAAPPHSVPRKTTTRSAASKRRLTHEAKSAPSRRAASASAARKSTRTR